MKKDIIAIRIFLYLFLIFFISFFLYRGIVPSGRIAYVFTPQKVSRFFSDLRPVDRINKTSEETRIIGDPVYFSVYTPRSFDEAKMTFKYKLVDTPPVFEAGVLVDKQNWRHVLSPVHNKVIEGLSLAWDIQENDGLYLFQKEKKYESIEEFLENPPENERIAVYNYDLDLEYVMKGYESFKEQPYILPINLKGDWQAFVYLKNEDLDISFDSVLESGEDLEVSCFYGDTLLKQSKGNNFEILNLPEGVYRLVVKVGKNSVVKSISLNKEKIVFLPQLQFALSSSTAFEIYTDSKRVQLTTVYPESLQTVKMNTKDFVVDKTYKQFEIETEKASSSVAYSELHFEKSGFSLSGDGVFAFKKESFFNPKIRKVDRNIDIKGDAIEYVLAKYNFPSEDDGFLVSKFNFDIRNAYRKDGEYEFMISIPGLRADDAIQDYLIVDEIKVEFIGKSLKEKILEIIN